MCSLSLSQTDRQKQRAASAQRVGRAYKNVSSLNSTIFCKNVYPLNIELHPRKEASDLQKKCVPSLLYVFSHILVVCVLSHTSSMCSLTYSIKMCPLLIVRALILVACVLSKWNVFSDSLYVSLTDSEHLECVLSKLYVLSLILV
jgi:hypothetical protein